MKKLIITLFVVVFCFNAYPQWPITPSIRIQEEDGSPTGRPRTLKVTNASLTDNADGTFSLDTGAGGGGGSASGANGDESTVQFNESGFFTGDSNFQFVSTGNYASISNIVMGTGYVDGSLGIIGQATGNALTFNVASIHSSVFGAIYVDGGLGVGTIATGNVGSFLNVTVGGYTFPPDMPVDDNYVIKWDKASDSLSWEADAGAGGGAPGGSDPQVQFSESSAFQGDDGFVYLNSTNVASMNNAYINNGIVDGSLGITNQATGNVASFRFVVADVQLNVGKGTEGSIDFGTNTLDDDIVGNLLIGYQNLWIQSAKLPPSNPAAIDAGEQIWRLLYDDTTKETGIWVMRLPNDYESNPVLKIGYSMVSGTSDEVEWESDVMAVTDGDSENLYSDGFAASQSVVVTVPGTINFLDEASLSISNDDSMTAGDILILRLSTDSDDAANDDAVGDRALHYLQLEYDR